jgi:hypothetical protein
MKFNVGDKVVITGGIETTPARWEAFWVNKMTDLRGETGRIDNADEKDNMYLVQFLGKNKHWQFYFPKEALTLAEGYVPPTKQELVCIKIKEMAKRRKELGYAF